MPTPNMALTLPTNHGSDDVWDTILEDVFTLIDEHDHTTGKGVKIPSAALKINADVAWAFGGTNYAITSLAALDFAAVTAASVSSYAGALFVNSSDSNNLYFRTISGTNVKITDGTTLNVSIVGGIGGDYAAVSALLDYDDASDTYRFRQETSAAVRQYAKVSIADLIIREYDPAGDATVPTNTVTIKSPDALAASYELTLPAALPGATSFVTMTSTGVLSTSTKARSAYTMAIDAKTENAAHTLSTEGGAWSFGNSATGIVYPVRGNVGDVITGISIRLNKQSDASNTLTLELVDTATGVGTYGAGIATFTATNAVNNPGQITLASSGATPHTMVAGKQYAVRISQSDSTPSGVDSSGGVEVSFQ